MSTKVTETQPRFETDHYLELAVHTVSPTIRQHYKPSTQRHILLLACSEGPLLSKALEEQSLRTSKELVISRLSEAAGLQPSVELMMSSVLEERAL